jgi:hypothetical protein
MSATNKHILDAIDDYRKKIIDEVERRCRDYCQDLCWAAIRYRRENPDAHDFTGNLLSSIVVCLYRERKPLTAYYASEQFIPKAIQVKMSANNKYRKRYFFNPDYSGDTSMFRADVKTDKGWGENDARLFFNSFTPKGNNLFDIVVAYPVEYADIIENERSTTGIIDTYTHAEKVGVFWLKLVRKS